MPGPAELPCVVCSVGRQRTATIQVWSVAAWARAVPVLSLRQAGLANSLAWLPDSSWWFLGPEMFWLSVTHDSSELSS